MTYYDVHTHKKSNEPDVVEVLSISPGMDPIPAIWNIGSLPGSTGSYISAGIHPWKAEVPSVDFLSWLETAPIAAIGEIGLDYAVETDREIQADVLRRQLHIAEKRSLPVIIHCVKAYNELGKILNEYILKAVIFHGYTGSPQQTRLLSGAGRYFSFGERALYSPKTIESFTDLDSTAIFAETDTSDVDIRNIYEALATVKTMSVTTLAAGIESNFKTVFE